MENVEEREREEIGKITPEEDVLEEFVLLWIKPMSNPLFQFFFSLNR